jgi:hypothetical protein
MRIPKKTKPLRLFALMLVMGAFLFAGTVAAYASDEPEIKDSTEADSLPVNETVNEIISEIINADSLPESKIPTENNVPENEALTTTNLPIRELSNADSLTVDDLWLTGETLHIIVTDNNNGETQTLELNLRYYAQPYDEYVTVQAADSGGRASNTIQFRNPFYVPQENGTADPSGESAAPDGENHAGGNHPFTPDGTGAVVDNVTEADGKEFFTVETPDGNVFYLVVDRQRNNDNVYLLNAVTENDLVSLAKPGDGTKVSAVPAAPVATPEPTPTPAPIEPTPVEPEKSGGNNSLIFIVIAVVAVGVAGYYFKIVRPKQNGGDYEDDPEEVDENEEFDVPDDDGEDEGE